MLRSPIGFSIFQKRIKEKNQMSDSVLRKESS